MNLTLAKETLSGLPGDLSRSEAIALLTEGPDKLSVEVAEALVSAWFAAENLATSFVVKKATHSWDREKGYSLAVTFINFVGGGAL